MITRACSLDSSPQGYVVGWVSELGPAWVRLPTTSTLSVNATYLGEDAAGLVTVCWDRGEAMAAYTQSDGTFIRCNDTVERIGAISHLLHASQGWVAAATRAGIEVLRRGEVALRPVSTRKEVRIVRVCGVPGGALVFWAGESDLGVIHVTSEGSEEYVHHLDVRIVDMHVAARGGRVSVVVGTDDEQVLVAELNGRGKMRERLHAVLRGASNPRLAWMVSEFLLATSIQRGVRVEKVGGSFLMVLDGVSAPYEFTFQQGRALAIQVQESKGEDVLLLRSRDRRGGMLDAHRIPCQPEGSELRRRTFAARRIFEQLGTALAATGYRERGVGDVEARELKARLQVGEHVLQLDARLGDEGVELGIDVGDAEPAPPPRSFARLARFFRRLGPEARAARDAMMARVAEVVGEGVKVVEAERSAGLTSLTLRADEVPTATELVRWLKALGEI